MIVDVSVCFKARLSANANKTHFHKEGFALGHVLKVRVFWNSEMT